ESVRGPWTCSLPIVAPGSGAPGRCARAGTLAGMDPAPAVCYRHAGEPTRIACQRCNRPICPQCMIPGAVGFQCPECVEQASRESRQRVMPYGGTRSRDPRMTSIVLIVLNVLVFVGVSVTGGSFGRLFDALSLKVQGYCPTPDGRILLADKAACLGEGLPWVD